MPFAYQQRLLQWKEKNPDFKVKLWTDEASLELSDVYGVYPDISVHHYEEAFPEPRSEIAKNFLGYIQDARGENQYAMVSNLLRHYLLAKEGGFYFDTDVEPISALPETSSAYGVVMLHRLPDERGDFYFQSVLAEAMIHVYPSNPVDNYPLFEVPTSALYAAEKGSAIAEAVLRDIDKCYRTVPFQVAEDVCKQRGIPDARNKPFRIVRSLYTSSRMLTRVLHNYARAEENRLDRNSLADCNFFDYFKGSIQIANDNSWSNQGMAAVQERSCYQALKVISSHLCSPPQQRPHDNVVKEALKTVFDIVDQSTELSPSMAQNLAVIFSNFQQASQAYIAPLIGKMTEQQIDIFLEELMCQPHAPSNEAIFKALLQPENLESLHARVFKRIASATSMSDAFANSFLQFSKELYGEPIIDAKLNAIFHVQTMPAESQEWLNNYIKENEGMQHFLQQVYQAENIDQRFARGFLKSFNEIKVIERFKSDALKAYIHLAAQSEMLDEATQKKLDEIYNNAPQLFINTVLAESICSAAFANFTCDNKDIKDAQDRQTLTLIKNALSDEITWYKLNYKNLSPVDKPSYQRDFETATNLKRLINIYPKVSAKEIMTQIGAILEQPGDQHHSLARFLYAGTHAVKKEDVVSKSCTRAQFKELRKAFIGKLGAYGDTPAASPKSPGVGR